MSGPRDTPDEARTNHGAGPAESPLPGVGPNPRVSESKFAGPIGVVRGRVRSYDVEGRELTLVFSDTQRDRISGVLLGLAIGDALGVPYEFGTPPVDEPAMLGGGLGGYEPGEGSDDSQQAVLLAQVGARGAALAPGPPVPGQRLTREQALDVVASLFIGWLLADPPDVGVQTRRVLSDAATRLGMTSDVAVTAGAGAACRAAASAWHAETGRSAGNGALMRCAGLALPYLLDREAGASMAREAAELTHADWRAGATCVLVGEALRVAVTDGAWEPRAGLDLLAPDERDDAASWLAAAVAGSPAEFADSGFTVRTFQGAVSAVHTARSATDAEQLYVEAVSAAVRGGGDTDTVAAVTGALAGALVGAPAIPRRWQERVVVRVAESGHRVSGRYGARALAAMARDAAPMHGTSLIG